MNIIVRITKPSTSSRIPYSFQDPPSRLNVTEYPSTEIVISAIDPSTTTLRDFVTVLVSVRYVNKEN